MKNSCGCGCGRLLVRREGEPAHDFSIRKYASRECSARAKKGKRRAGNSMNYVATEIKPKFVIHPIVDKFIYAKPRTA